MGNLVSPRVFFTGATSMDLAGVTEYLRHKKLEGFLADIDEALRAGIPSGMVMASLYAKLCYASVTTGRNANVTRTRGIEDNLKGCFDQGHGSIFDHLHLSFIVTDCSRIYTHEQVRHRTSPPPGTANAVDSDFPQDGWAYAQTSGRFCRLESIDLVWDTILDPVKELFLECLGKVEDTVYLAECKLGLRKPSPAHPTATAYSCLHDLPITPDQRVARRWVPDNSFDFDLRKRITSAIRRIAPNGQANEIGLTCNVRALRHVVQLRTARFAEAEIRDIFHQVYCLVKARWPLVFHGAKERIVGGLPEVYGMRQQPYDLVPGDPKALEHWDTPTLRKELATREAGHL